MSRFLASKEWKGATALSERVQATVASVCDRYQIDVRHLSLVSMSGFDGGLGNAIPLPLPFRRRYVVRYHACMCEAEPLALRGLFAHELAHVWHYHHASHRELFRFMSRYALFALTSNTPVAVGREWVTTLEHLTDLVAVRAGEGESISAWKRFKQQATTSGYIRDSWADMYLSPEDIDALSADSDLLAIRLKQCLDRLGGSHYRTPFRRPR